MSTYKQLLAVLVLCGIFNAAHAQVPARHIETISRARHVDTIADLGGFNNAAGTDDLKDTEKVFVKEVGSWFVYDAASVATADNVKIVDAGLYAGNFVLEHEGAVIPYTTAERAALRLPVGSYALVKDTDDGNLYEALGTGPGTAPTYTALGTADDDYSNSVGTIAAMQALTTIPIGTNVFVAGDRGGHFTVVTDATSTDDGGTYFDGTGRDFQRQIAGNHVYVNWWDTTTADDLTAIQSAMDYASANGINVVQFNAETYTPSDELYVRSNVHLKGAGEGKTIVQRAQGTILAQEAIFAIINYTSSTNTTYVADSRNIRISYMTLDFNFATWQDFTPAIKIDGRGLVTGDVDAMENIEIDHITFIDSGGVVPTGTPDAWCVQANSRAQSCTNLQIHHCRSPEWHQLVTAGGGVGWDGIWYYNNYVYHPRDNGMTVVTTYDDVTDGAGALGTVTHNRNVHIYDNTIVGPTQYGIWVGTDASARGIGARLTNVAITNNTIIQDDFVDVIGSPDRIGIGVTGCESELSKLVIEGNTVRYTDSVDANTDYAILIRPNPTNVTDTTTLAAFTQPAVGATVNITFGTDPDIRDKCWLAIGDATNAGGLYRVTAVVGAGVYTVERYDYPIGATDATVVPAGTDVVTKMMVEDVLIANNVCDGPIEVRNVIDGKILGNTCSDSPAVTNRSMMIQDAVNVLAANNILKVDPMWMQYNVQAQAVNNVFDQPALGGGWIQMKANTDPEGRSPHIAAHLSGNMPVGGGSMTKLIGQTGVGTHSLTGQIMQNGTPEGVVIADIGTTMQRVNGSGTAFWLKSTGTGNTGWIDLSSGSAIVTDTTDGLQRRHGIANIAADSFALTDGNNYEMTGTFTLTTLTGGTDGRSIAILVPITGSVTDAGNINLSNQGNIITPTGETWLHLIWHDGDSEWKEYIPRVED